MRLKSLSSSSIVCLIICAAGCGNQTSSPVSKVSATANPQVALYSISTGAAANVLVQFGLDTNYGLTTWTQPSPGGGVVNVFVAGMKANTPYHMRAVVQFS